MAGLRRLLALSVVVGIAVACLVLPAAGQTATPPTIDNFFPRCVDVGVGSDVAVSGRTSARSVSAVLYSPTGAAVTKGSAVPSSGFYSIGMTFTPAQTGSYEVRVSDGIGTVSAFIEVPCQAPTLEYDPPCFPVGYNGSVTMTARHFVPYGVGYMTYDVNGSETQNRIRIPVDGRGVFAATFKVTPSNRGHPGEGTDANRSLVATATWSPCPPGTVPSTTAPPATTTTSTTTVDTTPTTPPPTVTTLPGVPGIPTTTLPPTIDVPPPTPGVTLTVMPRIGPPGFVTGVVGTGFPPGPVQLTWSPGIGSAVAVAGPDGSFSTRVLIFPRDRLGPRALIATSGASSAFDGFLVVPATVHPSSGREVAQITRVRRFTQR